MEGFINSTYDAVINSGYAGSGSSISWEARTPNGVLCSQVGEGIDNVATELGLSTGNDWGVNRFGLLRKVNMIITNVQNSSTLNETEKIELKAHGNLMRGMIFFDQARKMGRFVPVKEVFTVENPEAVNIPMTEDVSESYKLIIEICKLRQTTCRSRMLLVCHTLGGGSFTEPSRPASLCLYR